jgi:hypothetical protein
MTKGEQARLMAWRLFTAGGRRRKRRAGVPAVRPVQEIVLQMETAPRRARRRRPLRSAKDAFTIPDNAHSTFCGFSRPALANDIIPF